jgi:ABC-type transporter Mla subunit MlaD
MTDQEQQQEQPEVTKASIESDLNQIQGALSGLMSTLQDVMNQAFDQFQMLKQDQLAEFHERLQGARDRLRDAAKEIQETVQDVAGQVRTNREEQQKPTAEQQAENQQAAEGQEPAQTQGTEEVEVSGTAEVSGTKQTNP